MCFTHLITLSIHHISRYYGEIDSHRSRQFAIPLIVVVGDCFESW